MAETTTEPLTDESDEGGLRRSITGKQLFFYTLGDVLGSGIYVLIGLVAAAVGGAFWIAFAVGVSIAAITGTAYAELVTKYPKAAGAALYVNKAFGNRVLTAWVRWLTRVPVTDGQSGFRALSGAAAAGAVVAHDYNYAQVLTLDLVAKGYRYAEVPISYSFRKSGDSFVKLGQYLRRVVPTVWRLLQHVPSAP